MTKIALIGFGTVGQGMARLMRDKAALLRTRYGFEGQIVAAVTGSRGMVYHPDGLDIDALLAASTRTLHQYPQVPGLERDWDALRLAQESSADIIVEASPSNLKTGQPALDVCHAAFDAGKHVVLANKGPLVAAYGDLTARADAAGVALHYEATIMAGTPALRLAQQALMGSTIKSVRGILNGTTNFILTQMEGGKSYADALGEAQALGYAESDPGADVDGWDTATKAVILSAAVFDAPLSLDDLPVTGISGITLADVQAAQAAGERWKLVAEVTPQGAKVAPIRLPLSDPMAHINGATNAITYHTDTLGDVSLVGPGAGSIETGYALLSDVLAITTGQRVKLSALG